MPFERRSDVQVLEDDGSDNVLQRRAAIASVLDALRSGLSHKLAACKTLASKPPLAFLRPFSLICPKRPLPRLNRFHDRSRRGLSNSGLHRGLLCYRCSK